MTVFFAKIHKQFDLSYLEEQIRSIAGCEHVCGSESIGIIRFVAPHEIAQCVRAIEGIANVAASNFCHDE